MTINEAADALLALRHTAAAAWPAMRDAAARGTLTEGAMLAWNRGVWNLEDAELRLAADLAAYGAEGPDGGPLTAYATADLLGTRLQVGYFAGVGTPPYAGALGSPIAGAALAYWLATALGIALAAAFVAWVASKAVQNFQAAQLDAASASIQEAIAQGLESGSLTAEQAAAALDALARLERERRLREEPKTPAWAKGVAVAGGAVAVGLLTWAVSTRIARPRGAALTGTPAEHAQEARLAVGRAGKWVRSGHRWLAQGSGSCRQASIGVQAALSATARARANADWVRDAQLDRKVYAVQHAAYRLRDQVEDRCRLRTGGSVA